MSFSIHTKPLSTLHILEIWVLVVEDLSNTPHILAVKQISINSWIYRDQNLGAGPNESFTSTQYGISIKLRWIEDLVQIYFVFEGICQKKQILGVLKLWYLWILEFTEIQILVPVQMEVSPLHNMEL